MEVRLPAANIRCRAPVVADCGSTVNEVLTTECPPGLRYSCDPPASNLNGARQFPNDYRRELRNPTFPGATAIAYMALTKTFVP